MSNHYAFEPSETAIKEYLQQHPLCPFNEAKVKTILTEQKIDRVLSELHDELNAPGASLSNQVLAIAIKQIILVLLFIIRSQILRKD